MRAHADECARAPAEGARASTEGARATTSQRAYGRARAPADERARVPTRGRASSSALARVCGLVRAHADEGAHMLTNSREHRPRARAPTRADEGTRIRPGARVRRLFFCGGRVIDGSLHTSHHVVGGYARDASVEGGVGIVCYHPSLGRSLGSIVANRSIPYRLAQPGHRGFWNTRAGDSRVQQNSTRSVSVERVRVGTNAGRVSTRQRARADRARAPARRRRITRLFLQAAVKRQKLTARNRRRHAVRSLLELDDQSCPIDPGAASISSG